MGSDGSAAGGGRSDLSEWQRSAGNEPDLPGEVTDGNRNRANWQKIKTEYITTDTSYRKLAQKYGISHVQIARVGKAEGWVELREQHVTNTMAKTIEKISDKQAEKMARIEAVTDKLLTKLEKAVEELDIQLYKQVDKEKVIEYNNTQRPDKPTKEVVHETEKVLEVKTIVDRMGLRQVTAALKDLKEIQMLKSELDRQEQEARIANLRKQADKDSDTVEGIEVVFQAGEEAWNE